MAYRIFVIPVHDDGRWTAELNTFLRAHKVVAVERRLVEQESNSFWSFCVDYLDSSLPASGATARSGTYRNKVDYREVLSPDEFAIFAKLRELRKSISQQDAVPVYTVFTNEQLAQIARSRATTLDGLEKIAGVGDARIERYGPRVLGLMTKELPDHGEAGG